MLEEKQAEVEHYRGRLERVQREYEERLHGTATELQRLQLEKTLLQARPHLPHRIPASIPVGNLTLDLLSLEARPVD